MESEKELLTEFDGRTTVERGGRQFVNAYIGKLFLHCSPSQLMVYMSVGKGRSEHVYSTNGRGVCTGRNLDTLDTLDEAMTIMKTSVILDELA